MEKVWRGRNMNGLKENQIQMNGAAELWPTDRKYHFKHIIGWNANENIWGDEAMVFTNPQNGNTIKPEDFVQATPENMSWDVAFPERISYYDTKESILKRLKPIIKDEFEIKIILQILYIGIHIWKSLMVKSEHIMELKYFLSTSKKDRNSYKIWSLW